MHGVTSEALVLLALLVFGASVILGLAFSALALAADDQAAQVIIAVVFMAGVGYLLASFDPMGLGGSFAWRLVIFASALGGGCIASRAIITHQRASGRSPHLAALVALGSLGFGTASAITLGVLLVISVAVFDSVSGY
jgi:hypothetical protein